MKKVSWATAEMVYVCMQELHICRQNYCLTRPSLRLSLEQDSQSCPLGAHPRPCSGRKSGSSRSELLLSFILLVSRSTPAAWLRRKTRPFRESSKTRCSNSATARCLGDRF